MKYRVIIRPEAEDDLREVFLWYEEKRKGLGYDFLLQVDAGIRFIARNPNIHQTEYRGTRKHFTKRFPYKIIYIVEKDKIIILAVAHGRRGPALIKKRIKGIK
ncbi:MAG: type II toxin-antitoxin system RelE/ParE family toxin [Deferribacteres bacterium]|nr:type II toxin-antitoxin system RelE/ParE family toxin [Deferribacteres bacterium]